MKLPGSSILPEQALIFFNARLHRPLKESWWNAMISHLKAHKPGVQDVSSIASLTKCARDGYCDLPRDKMLETFLAALSHPDPSARLLAIYGDYAWNVLEEHSLGINMLLAASMADPATASYHITLAQMFAASGKTHEALQQIHMLELLNTGGRLDSDLQALRTSIKP